MTAVLILVVSEYDGSTKVKSLYSSCLGSVVYTCSYCLVQNKGIDSHFSCLPKEF